jgi:hypothetical protein
MSAEVTIGNGGKQLDLHRLCAAVPGERVETQALTSIADGRSSQEKEWTA